MQRLAAPDEKEEVEACQIQMTTYVLVALKPGQNKGQNKGWVFIANFILLVSQENIQEAIRLHESGGESHPPSPIFFFPFDSSPYAHVFF